MQLREFVQLYRDVAARTGEPVELIDLGLPPEDLVRDLSAFDDDYQISRFFQFSLEDDAPDGSVFDINTLRCTHLRLLPGIDSLL